jgi:molecular chaperone DnaJ
MSNPYQILEISDSASQSEVKSAYRKLAKKYHPDVNKDPGAEEKFKQVSDAYESIINPKPQQNPVQQSHPAWDPFDMFHQRQGNTPVNIRINLDLSEVFKSQIKEVVYSREVLCLDCDGLGGKGTINGCPVCMGSGQNIRSHNLGGMFFQQVLGPCGHCSGKGKTFEKICGSCRGIGKVQKQESFSINIPVGSLFKAQVFHEKGNQAHKNQKAGPLVVEVGLNLPSGYQADNNYNLMFDKHIDPVEGMVGFEDVFLHPDGSKVNIKVKNGVEYGYVYTLPNKGLPISQSEFGNLQIRFLYNLPKELSEEEKSCLKSYIELRNRRKENEYDQKS